LQDACPNQAYGGLSLLMTKSKILAVGFHIPQKEKKKHVSINKPPQFFKMSKMQEDVLIYFKKR